jgi:hypothetical protein
VEENPKPRSRSLLVVSILVGILSGFAGAIFGVLGTTSRGILDLPESLVINAMFGGPIIGIGAGFTVAKLRPGRTEWDGCFAWGVLLVAAMLASSLLAGLSFYLIGRFGRH